MKNLFSFVLLMSAIVLMSFNSIDFDWVNKDAKGAMVTLLGDDSAANEAAQKQVMDLQGKFEGDVIAFYEFSAENSEYAEVVSKLEITAFPTVVVLSKSADPAILSGTSLSSESMMDALVPIFHGGDKKCSAAEKKACSKDKKACSKDKKACSKDKKSCSKDKKSCSKDKKACCSKKAGK